MQTKTQPVEGVLLRLNETKAQLKDCLNLSLEIQKISRFGSYVLDVESGIWTSSPVLDDIFGIDKNFKRNVEGWLRLVGNDHRAEMEKYFLKEVLGKKKNFDKIYRIRRRRDGKELWVHGYGKLEIDDSGRVVRMIGTIQDINDEKLFESQLRATEGKYKRLFETTTDAIVIVDMKGRLVDFNDQYKHMLGYTEEELRKKTYFDLTPKKWHKFENKILHEQILKSGSSDVYVKEYVKKNGTVFPVELKSQIIKDESGKPVSIWAIVRDITERKKVEDALEWEKEKLNLILSNTRHGIALANNQMRFELANPYFCDLFGYTQDELKKLTFREITYPEDLKQSISMVDKLNHGKIKTLDITKRYVGKNKKVIWAKVNVSLLRDAKGKILYHVVSLEDISDIKATELELRNSEEKIHKILMNMSDGVLVVNKENKITMVNPAFEKLSGFKASELVDKELGRKVVVKSEVTGNVLFGKETLLTEALLLDNNESLLLRKNGSSIPVEGGFSPVVDEKGYPQGGVMVVRDATESRKEDRMRKDFISLASHQLRTPLTGIKWFVELARTKVKEASGSEMTECLKNIFDSNERLISLVNDLLHVSRIESGKISKDSFASINIKRLLENALIDQKILADKKMIKIIGLEKVPEDYMVKCDHMQMIQVFGNIINNAIKYSKDSSVISISVKTKVKNKIVVLVEDHGVGIPARQQKRLFEKFFRADNVSNLTNGSGLGLYIVRSMVENNGGKVWIKSRENEGTKVFIELPKV